MRTTENIIPLSMSNVRVSIPARPEFLHVLRSVVGSVAALADLPVDAIEDLRIAVNEACAHLLYTSTPTEITVELDVSNGELGVTTSVDASQQEWPLQSARQTLTWQVLCALVDDARFERVHDGKPAIRFSKRRG